MSKIISISIVFLICTIIIFQFLSGEPEKTQIKPLTEVETKNQKHDADSTNTERIVKLDDLNKISDNLPVNDTEKSVQTSIAASPEEKEEIPSFLDDWKSAWQNSAGLNGDIAGYMKFYSEDFESAGFNKSRWKNSKGAKNKKKDWIEVWINNVKIKSIPENSTFQVNFRQEYSSSNYSDISTKTLTLKKENGEWAILAEQ